MTVTDAVVPGRASAGDVHGVDPPPARGGRGRRWATSYLAPLAGLVVLIGGWELYVRASDVRRLTLPAPSYVLDHLASNLSFYAGQAWITFQEAAWGFVVALVVAVVLAIFMAHSRFVERAALPVVVLVQCTPVAALVPVFLLWFGFRSGGPKILVAALFAFVPFVANAHAGFRSIDPDTFELLRSVDASRREVFFRLRVPHSLPYLFSAAKVCVGLSLVGAVIGELYGGSLGGLGFQIRTASARSLADQLWGSIFALALMGVVLTLALAVLERRLLRWHASQTLD